MKKNKTHFSLVLFFLLSLCSGTSFAEQFPNSPNSDHAALNSMFHSGHKTGSTALSVAPAPLAGIAGLNSRLHAPAAAPSMVNPLPRAAIEERYVSYEPVWKMALILLAGAGLIVLGASLGGLWWIAGGLGIFMLLSSLITWAVAGI